MLKWIIYLQDPKRTGFHCGIREAFKACPVCETASKLNVRECPVCGFKEAVV